jgi:anti-sigma B factor antagonist
LPGEQRHIADGTLEVRTAEENGARVITLRGELDLANAGTAEDALEKALQEKTDVIVDMRELEFIDSTGIALLVASLSGDDKAQIRFIPSASPAVTRVLELTGLAERLPIAEAR